MEGKTGEEFEAAAIDYIKRHPDATTSASSSTATAIPTNGRRRPSAAGWRTIAPRPTRCRAWSTRSPSSLFAEFGVLTEAEVRSRYEVKLEKYNKLMNIEIRAMKRMVRRDYLPAINRYAAKLANGITSISNVLPDGDTSFMKDKLEKLAGRRRRDQPPAGERSHELHHAYSGSGGSAEAREHERPRDRSRHGRPARGRGRHGDHRRARSTGRCPPTTRSSFTHSRLRRKSCL